MKFGARRGARSSFNCKSCGKVIEYTRAFGWMSAAIRHFNEAHTGRKKK